MARFSCPSALSQATAPSKVHLPHHNYSPLRGVGQEMSNATFNITPLAQENIQKGEERAKSQANINSGITCLCAKQRCARKKIKIVVLPQPCPYGTEKRGIRVGGQRKWPITFRGVEESAVNLERML